MAQDYDKYEYWRQFDDNSRWVGFIGNEEKISQQENETDETITMLDYVLARTAYDVSDDSEDERHSPKQKIMSTYLPSELESKVDEMHIAEKKEHESRMNAKNTERRLEETFLRMKETLK